MAPTPSLARLSLLARTGGQPPDPKARRNERAITESEFRAPRLPAELWDHIVTLAIDDGECAQLDELCKAEGMPWSGWCEDGSIYERVSARFGWYGDLPNWKAVQAHYQKGREWGIELGANDPKAYFRNVCARLQRIRDLTQSYHRTSSGLANTVFGLRTSKVDGEHVRWWDPPYAVPLAKYAVFLRPHFLEQVPGSMFYATPLNKKMHAARGTIDGYAEIAKVAARKNGTTLKYVPGSINHRTGLKLLECIQEYVDIAKIALEDDGLALRYVPGSLSLYGDYFEDVAPLKEYAELAKVAVRSRGAALKHVPGSINTGSIMQTRGWIEEYAEIAKLAVVGDGEALRHVPPSHPKYATIAETAVTANPYQLIHVPDELPEYATIAGWAIQRDPAVIKYVPETHRDHGALEALAKAQRERAPTQNA